MAWNSLNNKDNGHSVGLAYLTDVVADEGIRSIVPGEGIGVNNTNPLNPTVSNTGVVELTFGATQYVGSIVVQPQDGIGINFINDTTVGISNEGVLSLDGLAGALTFSSSDDSININPSGTIIDLTSNGGGGGGVSSLSDGTTALTGAITLIGEGCSITATADPSPAITISIPVPPPSGVVAITIDSGSASKTGTVDLASGNGIALTVGGGNGYGISNTGVLSLNGVAGAMNLTSGGTITFTPNVGANTLSLDASPAVAGVSSVSDGTNVATGAVKIVAGEGIETVYDAGSNTFTLSSDPFVGIYYLTTAQNLTAVGLPWINNVVNLTTDPQSDVAVISYDAPTGTWTVIKEGVYFLNFSAGIIQNDATWTLGSFCQCFIVITSGATQLNFCNSLTPSQTSGVGSFNGQVFGYIPLSAGTTITCGFQWYLTAVGATVAQFQPRTNGVNNGTNFNWVYIRPFL